MAFDSDQPSLRRTGHAGRMKHPRKGYAGIIAGLGALLLTAGCDRSPTAQPLTQAPKPPSVEDVADDPFPLLVPYRGLMIGLIDWSAYGIFKLSVTNSPMDDDDWSAAGMAAVNIIATSTLLSMEGSGADDKRRLSDPAWRGMVGDLQNASLFVAMAVQQRNRADFVRRANLLADTCQACHDKFRVLPRPDTSRFAVR